MTVEDRRSPKPASPAVAAFLSFVLPGLGQIAVGAIRRGLILGVPLVAVIVLGIVLFLFDKSGLVGAIVRPEVVLGLVILDLLLGLIHFIAIGDAYRLARRRVSRSAWQVRAGAPSLLAFLLVLTIAVHGGLGAIGFQAYNTMETIYPHPQSSFSIPIPSFAVGTLEPGATPTPTPIPGPAWAADGRLNILLIGGDAGPGRWNLRTDTLIVFSADIATGKVAMFGIPRNLCDVPLAPEDAKAFPGGIFPCPANVAKAGNWFINALWVYADGHRSKFPGGDDAGFRAITGAVQQLVGVPLDGAVVVKLNGFVDLVNALGGVWIDVPSKMVDHAYPMEDGSGHVTLTINAGCQKLNGHYALAFARIRHIDSDYARMGRQQVVLDALARQLDPLAVLTKLPDLLQIAGSNLKTTFSPDDAASLAQFATLLDVHHIKNVLFAPPKYREYLTAAEIARIQKVVQTVFAPKPTASPTPAPSVNPSATPKPTKTPAPTPVPCPPG
jgi:LCP family protein required for cell wall assembly